MARFRLGQDKFKVQCYNDNEKRWLDYGIGDSHYDDVTYNKEEAEKRLITQDWIEPHLGWRIVVIEFATNKIKGYGTPKWEGRKPTINYTEKEPETWTKRKS